MKKLLLLPLLMSNLAYADVFNFNVTQQNFYCKPNKFCDVFVDFDVMIVNETNVSQRYNIGFDLELVNPPCAYSSGDGVIVPPRGTFNKHYHHIWKGFILQNSNSYLLKSSIAVYVNGQPQKSKETTTTVWVY